MDQAWSLACRWLWGIPHARGDGPPATTTRIVPSQYSPRPWGWTGLRTRDLRGAQVFPTPVGMDRAWTGSSSTCAGIPHARGDGPCVDWFFFDLRRYSPRPWGWTGARAACAVFAGVFPTPVGMDRRRIEDARKECGIPHARGDGPHCVASSGRPCEYSPRPWGWTARPVRGRFVHGVFPTPVGMDR